MLGLQFTQQGKITEVNKMEICESIDSSKVKITKVLLTPEDFATLLGDETANYPIIPGRIAIGQISDASDYAYLEKEREFLSILSLLAESALNVFLIITQAVAHSKEREKKITDFCATLQ